MISLRNASDSSLEILYPIIPLRAQKSLINATPFAMSQLQSGLSVSIAERKGSVRTHTLISHKIKFDEEYC